jgi:hypothetical protein
MRRLQVGEYEYGARDNVNLAVHSDSSFVSRLPHDG